MKYLLILHEALKDSLVDEINATGAYLEKSVVTCKNFIEIQGIDGLGIRLNDNFRQVAYDSYTFYHTSAGSQYISGHTEIDIDQFLKHIGIKESDS